MRENAKLKVETPEIVVAQGVDGLEANEPDPGIKFDVRSHALGALNEAFLDQGRATSVDVIEREAAFCLGRLAHRLGERPFLNGASIEKTGFIEMDVRFDETRHKKAAARVQDRRGLVDDRRWVPICHADDEALCQ